RVNERFTNSAQLLGSPRSYRDVATFYRHTHRRYAAMQILNLLTGQMVEVRVPRPGPRTA
ncbi:hypothetical protein ACLBX9_30030, partial [Methylobacterium sp. A49B]